MSHVDDGLLHAYLDGELSPAEAQGVDAHLAQCSECRRRLEEERALIARAAELLALAAPPDRELPPFRAGDVKPPTRLWWHVRLPLAWAATVLLALGIGTYLGRGVERARQPDTTAYAPPAERRALDARASPELAEKESRVKLRGSARTPPAARPPAPAPARAVADSIAPLRREPLLARADTPAAYAYGERAADSAARITHGKASQDERDRWQKGDAISVDSARRVLGVDPLVVPGVPIEAFYRGRSIGYSGVVIVEQALDSNTMIEVINARSAPALLNEVVVTGAQPVRSRPAEAAPPPAPRPAPSPGAGLFHDVRGPLSADSLATLRRLLQPLRP
ncbi:MAG: hypothetical protein DMD45_08855 [Gemmatimonadetes bacterium]|nr:MAG: hypothetical protein DMD45_08855 [Gemmatimonadota bacterium]